MENSEYSPLKYKMSEFNEPPNIILNKINTEGNYNMPNIITKNIIINNNNPIYEINSKKVQPKNLLRVFCACLLVRSCFFFVDGEFAKEFP